MREIESKVIKLIEAFEAILKSMGESAEWYKRQTEKFERLKLQVQQYSQNRKAERAEFQ